MNANPSELPAAAPTDPVAAVTHPDPYPYYASLRAGPALVWHEGLRSWVASRADAVASVLQARDALRVRPAGEPVPRAIAGRPAGEVFGHLVRMNDGTTHAAHKPMLQRPLAGLDLDLAHAAALRVAADAAQLPLSDAVFALPVRAVAQLLGFADAMLPQVEHWMRDFVACLSPLAGEAQLQAASSAAVALMERFAVLAAAAPPREATLLAAIRADSGGAVASRALLANLVGLLSQTCDATAGLLGNSLIALAREPQLRETAVHTTRDALLAVVQETARHDPSVHNTRRFAPAPATVAGVGIGAGDAVLLVLAAANRDPALNPEPERFMASRAQRRSLGFGHGMHACPGEALACRLAASGLEALLAGQGADFLAVLRERGWHYRPSVNARIPVFH